MNATLAAKRTLLTLGLILATVIVLAIGLVLWVFNTHSGTEWALRMASRFSENALQVRQVDGKIAGPLQLHDLRYRDAAGSIDVTVQRVALELDASQLLHESIHIQDLQVNGVRVALGPPRQEPEEASKPFSLDPPVDMLLDRVRVTDVAIRRDEAVLLAVDSADLIAAWTDAGGVAVKQLDVRSPQGQIQFAGNVHGGKPYEGTGEGRVRWQVGTRTYAAHLNTQAAKGELNADVHISSPLAATLKIEAK
ncbi:MAG: hypothetical protein ACJ8MR_18505, partial [Povalibacter sp.]